MAVPGPFRNAKETIPAPAGTVVFEKGDKGDRMYGVISGEVVLTRDGNTVAKLGPDAVFGEMAIVDGSPRMATATATADSELAVIDRHLFLFLVHETPTFALQVMSAMAERLRDA